MKLSSLVHLGRSLVLLSALGAVAHSSPPETDPMSDWVVDGDFAYGLLRPEAVAPGNATDVHWAGDGENLVIVSEEPRPSAHLLDEKREPTPFRISVWNRKTMRTRDIGRVDGEYVEIAQMGHTSSVMIESTDTTILNCATGRTVRLVPPTGLRSLHPEVSPNERYLVTAFRAPDQVGQQDEAGYVFRVYDIAGNPISSGTLAPGLQFSKWSPEGFPIFTKQTTRTNPDPKPELLLGPNGFAAYSGPSVDAVYEPEEEGAQSAAIAQVRVHLTHGESNVEVQSAWLDSSESNAPDEPHPEPRHALISAETSGEPRLSPTKEAVAYISRGVPLVRRILKVPKDSFDKAVRRAKQNQAMSDAKQAATACLIYAADYDDAFPLAGSFSDSIDPYMKNQEISHRFTYTFGGGLLARDIDPTKLEIGYVQTEFGRAVAYADSSVKWIPNP